MLRSAENHFTTETRRTRSFGFYGVFLRDLRASVVDFHAYGWTAGQCDTQYHSTTVESLWRRSKGLYCLLRGYTANSNPGLAGKSSLILRRRSASALGASRGSARSRRSW